MVTRLSSWTRRAAFVLVFACAPFLSASVPASGRSCSHDTQTAGAENLRKARGTPSGDSQAVRIMTWNIRYNNPDDGVFAWPRRRDQLLSFVLSENPDVFCIQEGLHDQVAFLKDGLRGFTVCGVGRDDGKEKGEYSAIYFNTRRFSADTGGTFWLSPTPSVPGKAWDAALPRIVTWVRLVDAPAGNTLFVFNTHFDHQGVAARENSALLLRAKVRDIAGVSPVVVAGDFNSTDTDSPYCILTSSEGPGPCLADAMRRSLSPHSGPSATFTGFELKDPDPGERIDYLFVSESVRVLHHATLLARGKAGFLSDHLPVMIDISLPTER